MENQKYKELLVQSGSCPASERLWDYAHGKVNDSSAQELEKHLAHCVLCSGAVEGFAMMDSPASLKQVASKNPFVSSGNPVKFVTFSLALLCVISILWWWNSKENTNSSVAEFSKEDKTELPDEKVNVNTNLEMVAGEVKGDEVLEIIEKKSSENDNPKSITKNRWKDELFTIEKKGIVLANRNQVKLEIVDRPLTPIIYIQNLKVMDFTDRNNLLELPFEVPSNLHPRFANPREVGAEQLYTDIDTVYYRDLLESAILNFSRGVYNQSYEQFSFILKRNPKDDNALFYGGLAQYEMNEWKKAISLLEKLCGRKESAFSEEANWHLALAYLKNKDSKEAQDCLLRIAEGNGFYSIQAKQLLRK